MNVYHNTPSTGYIAWDSVQISYKGTTYNIADGNTSKKYVWWDFTTPNAFQTTNTLPDMTDDDILVFMNKGGFYFIVPFTTVTDGSLIVPGSILTDALAANAITTEKIAAGAVTADQVAANAIGAAAIAANAVIAEKISSGAITADKIAVDAVTAAKIAADAVGAAAIAAGVISADHISAGAITASKIATGAVNADKVAANAIGAAAIAAGAVVSDAIAAGAITANKVGANEIITLAANIKDGIIDNAKIKDATITSAKIANVDTEKITVGGQPTEIVNPKPVGAQLFHFDRALVSTSGIVPSNRDINGFVGGRYGRAVDINSLEYNLGPGFDNYTISLLRQTNFASRIEKAQADFAAGTLSGVEATADGLKLEMAGSDVEQVDDTQAEFAAGTLNRVVGMSDGLELETDHFLDFNGTSDNVIIPNIWRWYATTVVTFKHNGSSTYGAIYQDRNFAIEVDADHIGLKVFTDSSASVHYGANSSWGTVVYTGPVEGWHNIAVSRNANSGWNVVVVLDGQIIYSGDIRNEGSYAPNGHYNYGRIGMTYYSWSGSSHFRYYGGLISYVANYNVVLDPAEMQNCGENNWPTHDLYMQYKFDEGSGSTLGDSVGSNDGTISGATWTDGYEGEGTRISPPIDIGVVGEVASSKISWDATFDWSETVEIETSIDDGNTWQTASNHGPIPGLPSGSLTGMTLLVRQTLKSSLRTRTPTLHLLAVTLTSAYNSSGSRLTPVIDLSPVGAISGTLIRWTAALNGQALTIETNVSLDGGLTWLGWKAASNESQIPDLEEGTNITNARLQCRQTLVTYDGLTTPVLEELTVDVGGAWTHYGIRSDGVKTVDGQRDDGASTPFVSVSNGALTLGVGRYDELMIEPNLTSLALLAKWASDDSPFYDKESVLAGSGVRIDAYGLEVGTTQNGIFIKSKSDGTGSMKGYYNNQKTYEFTTRGELLDAQNYKIFDINGLYNGKVVFTDVIPAAEDGAYWFPTRYQFNGFLPTLPCDWTAVMTITPMDTVDMIPDEADVLENGDAVKRISQMWASWWLTCEYKKPGTDLILDGYNEITNYYSGPIVWDFQAMLDIRHTYWTTFLMTTGVYVQGIHNYEGFVEIRYILNDAPLGINYVQL